VIYVMDVQVRFSPAALAVIALTPLDSRARALPADGAQKYSVAPKLK